MAQLALAAAGAAVGYAIGGPTGAQIGWSIGAAAGGMVFAENTKGPRITDMKIKDGGYGSGIPKTYGTSRVNGNLIWSSDLIEKAKETGGKGGPTYTTYSYSVNCAVGICEGPINCVLRIWANGAVIYDTLAGTSDSAVIPMANVTVYIGSEDQTPDPVMEAALGAGNVPAHRGMVYVVFEGLQLEKFGNRLPKFDFEIASDGTTGTGTPTEEVKLVKFDPLVWGNSYNYKLIGTEVWAFNDNIIPGTDTTIGTIQRCTPGGDFISTVEIPDLYSVFTWNGYSILETSTDLWLFGRLNSASPPGPGSSGVVKVSKADPTIQTSYGIPSSINAAFSYPAYSGDAMWVQQNYDKFHIKKWSIYTQDYTGDERIGQDGDDLVTTFNCIEGPDGTIYYCTKNYSTSVNLNKITSDGVVTTLYSEPSGSDSLFGMAQLSSESVFLLITDKLLEISTADGTILRNVPIEPLAYAGAIFYWGVNLVYDPVRNWLCWLSYNVTDNTKAQFNTYDLTNNALGLTVVFPASGELSQIFYGDASIQGAFWMGGYYYDPAIDSYAYSIFRISPSVCNVVSRPLSAVILDICGQVGLSAVDVSDVASISVKGYVRNNQMTARAAIDTLMQAYSVDAIESDGTLKFLRKTSGTVGPVLLADELGAGSKTGDAVDLVNLTRTQELELPCEVSVRYIDRELEYDPGQQYARRADVLSTGKISVDVPVVLSASEAMWLANTYLYRAWVQRDKIKFSTTQKFDAYEPTDMLSVPFGSENRFVRLMQKVEDGVQIEWEAVSEDLSVYAQFGTSSGGLAGGTQTTPVYTDILLYVFETPVLRDQDDGLQFTVAVGAADASKWLGGDLYYAPTGTTSWARIGTLPAVTVVGTLTSNLAAVTDPITDALDTTNTFSVHLTTGALSSVTYAELMSGFNTAVIQRSDGTVEVLGFQTATLTGTNTYTLSNLLRRIRQNSSFSGGVTGDKFVLLNTSQAELVPMQLASLGSSFDFKAPRVGQAIADADIVTATLTGMSKKPLSPIEVAGTRDGSGNLTITWTRRTRIGGSWATGENGPLGESSEAYEVDIMNGSTVVRTLTSTTPTVIYTASDQNTDFGSLQASVTLNAYQMSAYIGRGYPAAATV